MARKTETLEVDMEFSAIAGTPLRVSRVALGTWAIGGWMWGGTDEAELCVHHQSVVRPRHQRHRHGAGLWIWLIGENRWQGDSRRSPAR